MCYAVQALRGRMSHLTFLIKHTIMEKSTNSSTLDKKKKVARATKPRSTPKKPSYKESQNEEKGTYEKSKDGYPEKNPSSATKKSGQ